MAFQSPTRVQETSVTTGTGDVTLTGAVTGMRTFAIELVAGSLVEYAIEEVDANGNPTGAEEYGIGKMISTTVLNRLAPIGGSAATPITLAAGTKRVMVTLLGTTATTLTQWFGDGSDGDVTVTTTITLTRDVYYNNLTMGAAGIINTNGFHVFVAGVLLDTGNVAGAIRCDGNAGTVGNVITGGAAGAGLPTQAIGLAMPSGGGGAGGSGGTTTGTAGAATGDSVAMGGLSGASGKGGTSGANIGGVSRAATAQRAASTPHYLTLYLTQNTGDTISVGGPGGGGGAGDGTNKGTGGGGGGGGGGVIWLSARIVSTTGSTPVGWIRANGGASANGYQTAPLGNAGGGGGASGGGGGYVYMIYQGRIGTAVTGLITVDGGIGGNGGPGFGTGIGGDGGQGAGCGRITLASMMTGITQPVTPGAAGTTPTAASTTAGTAGTAGVQGRATL